MNKTKAWILALGVSTMVVAGVMVALTGQGGGEPRPATSMQASVPETATPQAAETTGTIPASATSTETTAAPTAASAAQVQQVLMGVMAQIMVPSAADGQLKPVSPAEIENRVRVELAKIGLRP